MIDSLNKFTRQSVVRIRRKRPWVRIMFFGVPYTNVSWLPRWAGFVLAVVLAPFMCGNARASCGDYVRIASHQQDTAAEAKNAPGSRGLTEDSGKPCHGPNCSRGNEQMPPLPASPVTPTVDHAAVLMPQSMPPSDGAAGSSFDHLSLYPSNSPFRIERPPRF
jgi:hypothetical protein